MPVVPGQELLHYRLVEKIGEGGMGVVWKAIDTTLDREVAIKILPDAFSFDDERLARFEREARLLASLNNPHIATIHGLHEADGVRFLAMEFVGGEDLAQRLSRGPLAVDDAIEIARQIAVGLEEAHETHVIHRDLKPANVRVTAEGKVKLLDFGLAKTAEPPLSEASPSEILNSPTTLAGTVAGVILGTAGYMSPEQARGKAVDRRTDVWAFGCVLYEMLTGERAFAGETITDVLAAIVHREPDLDSLPATTPPGIRRLLRRCLRKDPSERLRDIGDVRLEMLEACSDEDLSATTEPNGESVGRGVTRSTAGLLALAGIVTGLAIGFLAWRVAPEDSEDEAARVPRRPLRFPITFAEPSLAPPSWGGLALTPDGHTVVYGTQGSGTTGLVRVDLETLLPEPIPGGEKGRWPLISPDGEWVAFTADGTLKKMPLSGGQAVDLTEVENPAGSWGDDGWIYFAEHYEGIARVRSDGGRVERLIEPPDDSESVHFHGPPHPLPGGKGFLYARYADSTDVETLHLVTLPDLDDTPLIEDASLGRYSAGHLVYSREGDLLASPFDLERLRITGEEVSVLQPGMDRESQPRAWVSTWAGTMAYVPSQGDELATMVWIDQDGNETPIPAPPREYVYPRLSPDGTRIAVAIRESSEDWNIWVYDLRRDVLSRVTRDEKMESNPVWLPNGRELVFCSDVDDSPSLYRVSADGSGDARQLTTGDSPEWPLAATNDGKSILVDQWNRGRAVDIVIMDAAGEGESRPLVATDLLEGNSALSPDGRWLAYEQGEEERRVYVQPFAGPGERRQVSNGEGHEPVWSHDGTALYYRVESAIYVVRVAYEPEFTLGKPELLLETDAIPARNQRNYDVARDGRFLVLRRSEPTGTPPQIKMVFDWLAEVEQAN